MEYNIAVVKGDGIGPEIVSEAMLVLDKVGEKFGHKFGFQEVLAGGCSIDKNGIPLTDETIEICKNADSVLLGAVGGPKWDDVPSAKRPEKARSARRTGPVRQPASGADAQGTCGCVPDQA